MVSLVLGNHMRSVYCASSVLGHLASPLGAPTMSQKWGFHVMPENLIPALEEHRFVPVDVAAVLSLGLPFPLAWIVTAASQLVSLTTGSPPAACPPGPGPPESEGCPGPSPEGRNA